MHSPYRYYLKKLEGHDNVTIHRANATDVTGKVEGVEEDGCVVRCQAPNPGRTMSRVFIAYEDIRGVATEGWDLDNG